MATKVLYCRVSEEAHNRLVETARRNRQSIATVATAKLDAADGQPDIGEATTDDLRQRCDTLERIAYGQHQAQARTMDLLTTILAAMAAHWDDTAAEITRAVEADPESDTLAKRVATRMSDAALASTGQDKPS